MLLVYDSSYIRDPALVGTGIVAIALVCNCT